MYVTCFSLGVHAAFHASISHDVSNPSDGQVIIYDKLLTNNGGSYNSTTGIFRAPVKGIYAFFAYQLTGETKYLETVIVQNGREIAYTYSGTDNYDSSGSNMVVTQLELGDEVWVHVNGHHHDNGRVIVGLWTTFSGFLLHAIQ